MSQENCSAMTGCVITVLLISSFMIRLPHTNEVTDYKTHWKKRPPWHATYARMQGARTIETRGEILSWRINRPLTCNSNIDWLLRKCFLTWTKWMLDNRFGQKAHVVVVMIIISVRWKKKQIPLFIMEQEIAKTIKNYY